MSDSKIIVTISGNDRVGIVAGFANVMAKYKVNIEDIRQSIMQTNQTDMKDHFVMFLMADISQSDHSFQEIKQAILKVGEELRMETWVQKKTIFDKMHTI
jgi:ACT domain-containing protein